MINPENVPNYEAIKKFGKLNMSTYTPVIILVCIALVFLGLALHGKLQRTKQAPNVAIPQLKASTLLSGRSQFYGSPKAPYTLVEFGDYECPPCRRVQPLVEAALKKYSGRVKLDFRELPLVQIHPHAEAAAVAAESGRTVGKFWVIHDRLYKVDLSHPGIILKALTSSGVGLNVKAAQLQLAQDAALERKLSVNATPSFFLCCPDGSVFRLQGVEALGLIVH